MAVVPLYHVKPHVKAPKWAKFPEDFYVVENAIVDDHIAQDPRVSSFRWSLKKPGRKSRSGRARRFEGVNPRRIVYLSHVVWEIENGPVPDGMTIDHRDLNSLDDRLENLRLANQSEQNRNQAKKGKLSPYKGVRFHRYGSAKAKHFHATICPQYHPVCLAYYHVPEEAAFAYNVAASRCYGEFARLNEIPPDSVSPDRQQEIRSIVEQKLRSRGLIPTP